MDKLTEFIEENSLDPVCLLNLIDCGYTYENLQFIENDDLNFIFPNREDTALRSEFRAKLFEWKAKNKKNLQTLNQPKSVPTQNVEANMQSGPNVCKSAVDILQSTSCGKKIIELYNSIHVLSEENRRKIVHLISENFYNPQNNTYASVKLAEIEKLANEIVNIFPSEKIEIYFIGRKAAKRSSPGGILFNRLHNHFKKRKMSPKTVVSEPETAVFVASSEIVDCVQKLKFYVGTEDDSMELWTATHEFRKNFISNPDNNFAEVISQFPLFKQATGFKFLEHDFNKLHPNRQFGLTTKWEDTVPKLMSYYNIYLKDNFYKKLFKSLDDSVCPSSKDCILFMCLHAVIKPSHRFTVTHGNVKSFRKATIEDSVCSTVLQVSEVNDLQNHLEQLNNKNVESNTPIQPFVIVVGTELTNLTEFYVSFGEHLYKFSSFVLALDICFKVYQVFGLKYPNESHKVWSFLQEFMYNISTPFDIKHSNVVNVIEDLQKM
ncbi:uncharacterized protein [Drosophila takahashii]|uniref:uncharacterized protein isoform X1 n=1 Tax=Drosophila takahashii TaxID=29030 RepID=UPI0038991FF5